MTAPSTRASRLALDVLLLLMVFIWAANYSLVKVTLHEIEPLTFNAIRLTIASCFFGAGWLASRRFVAEGAPGAGRAPSLAAIFLARTPITRPDWILLGVLGVVGHFVYQLCFINGLARTTAANSALISGCTPVAVALLSALVGHERIGRAHWAGAILSLGGVYLVVGRGARVTDTSFSGDMLILAGVAFWAIYTVYSRVLLARLSPLVVTSATMILGSILFVAVSVPEIARVDWRGVSPAVWLAIVVSALFALNVSYLIWYTAVQRLGSARTAVYSNMVPLAAMVIAGLWLGERIDAPRIVGAGAILGGVLLTRVRRIGSWNPDRDVPVEG